MTQGMTKQEVAALFHISTKTVERNSKAGGWLPEPAYVGKRSPRWNREKIYAIYNGVQTNDLRSSR